MPESKGYELRADVKDFQGAVTHDNEGETVDIGARLKNGNGRIVTDDPAVQAFCEESDLFKDAPAEPKKRRQRKPRQHKPQTDPTPAVPAGVGDTTTPPSGEEG